MAHATLRRTKLDAAGSTQGHVESARSPQPSFGVSFSCLPHLTLCMCDAMACAYRIERCNMYPIGRCDGSGAS